MKIVMCGSSGVGKSTLIDELREFFEEKGIVIFTGTTRRMMEKGFPINDDQPGDYNKTQLHVMGEHLHELLEPSFVSDRSLIDAYIYTQYLANKGLVNHSVSEALANTVNVMKVEYDLVLYIPIEFPMESDGVRTTSNQFRLDIDDMMKAYLNEEVYLKGADNIHQVGGTIEERVNDIKSMINAKG